MARTLENIKKRRYKVMNRTPAAFSVPADLTEHNTLLATFSELGYCRDKTIKSDIVKGDEETLDDGKKKTLGRNGVLEGVLLQSGSADYTNYEGIEDIEQDILLVSEEIAIFFPNAILTFDEGISSGDTEAIPFKYEAENLASKAEFRTRFAVPTS